MIKTLIKSFKELKDKLDDDIMTDIIIEGRMLDLHYQMAYHPTLRKKRKYEVFWGSSGEIAMMDEDEAKAIFNKPIRDGILYTINYQTYE